MGVINEDDSQDNSNRKSKKRKICEPAVLRVDVNHKRIKVEILGDVNALDEVARVESSLGARNSPKKEKVGKYRIDKEDELNNNKKKKKKKEKKKKKKKKNKIGDRNRASQTEDVPKKVEPKEDKRRKKKKKRKKEENEPIAVCLKNEFVDDVDEQSLSNGEDGGTKGRKRKKCVGYTLEGASASASASASEITEGDGAVGSAGFVENRTERKIVEQIDSAKGKKKKDDLGAASVDEGLTDNSSLLLISNGESNLSRGSKRKGEKFIGSHMDEDANANALKTNKRNNSGMKLKKVRFSDLVEYLSLADNSRGTEKLKDHSHGKKKVRRLRRGKQLSKKDQNVRNSVVNDKEKRQTKKVDNGRVKGKRFTKEEDEIVETSVLNYIEKHQLGEKGLEMVLNCIYYPQVRDCWREIGQALPSRPHRSIYNRAHVLFERCDSRHWTQEEIEFVKNFHQKYGPDWKKLAEEIGKPGFHVKDKFHRLRYPNMKKRRWSQDEYKALFDLVNMDLRMKAFEEKKSKHGKSQDNISWEAISKRLTTRSNALCSKKWYDQLTSPMVAEGKWADADDYRLLIALDELDAACQEEVDWDNLLEHRSGDVCRKRWSQMVRNIGDHGTKSFAEQVEIISKSYCPDDSKPVVH